MIDSSVTVNFQYKTVTSFPWIDDSARYTNTVDFASINHYPLDTQGDDGGPFILIRNQDSPVFHDYTASKYRGLVTCQLRTSTQSPMSAYSSPSDSALMTMGTKAIAASAPTNPSFDLSTALGELRNEGLPHMVSGFGSLMERSKIARNAGSNYLNVEFGWKPLIRDVRSFANTVKQSGALLDSYRKGSDVKTRVAYEGTSGQESRITYGAVNCSPTQANLGGSGWVSESREYRHWFRGAFRYHIPVRDSTLGKFQTWMSMSDHLLGWKVTPETLWNISPWTWAADWGMNIGDVMTNISNLGKDGLVLQYGYQMGSTHLRTVAQSRLGSENPFWVSRSSTKDYLRRVPSTPYGFGVNTANLSGKQIAVMAALGLSKT